MSSIIAVLLFSIILISFVFLNISIIYALLIGYFIFLLYGITNNFNLFSIIKKSIMGIKTVKNVIIIFILIGITTAMWRASGTIAIIIYLGSKIIVPSLFIFFTFILCSILSILIGTALGTSATMGVICIAIARTLGINEYFVAGAIISGVYFGDRCSPLSSSALIVAEITNTNLYNNIKNMIKTTIIPFIITSIFYICLGFISNYSNKTNDVVKIFQENYNLNLITLIPALLIVFLSIFKINAKITMTTSIITSIIITYIFQNKSFIEILKYSLYGYEISNPVLNSMMSGGGILSMVRVSIIILISSSYSGIFEETKMLLTLKKYVKNFAEKTTNFAAVLLTALVTAIVTCNQTLTSILTYELNKDLLKKDEMAITLENTAILVPALVPWSIALSVPLQAIEVDNLGAIFAFYIYFLPIYHLILSFKGKKRNKSYITY